jgi:hypothetical protein
MESSAVICGSSVRTLETVWVVTVVYTIDLCLEKVARPIKRAVSNPQFHHPAPPSLHPLYHSRRFYRAMSQTSNYADFTFGFHVNMFPAGTKPTSPMTNTLVVTGISRSCFQNPVIVSTLERHFQLFGRVHSWAPLPSFGRIMVVYYDDEDAERARRDFDATALRHTHDWYVFVGSCPSPVRLIDHD